YPLTLVKSTHHNSSLLYTPSYALLQCLSTYKLFPYTTLFRSHRYVYFLSNWSFQSLNYKKLKMNRKSEDFLDLLKSTKKYLRRRSDEHTSELQSRFDLVCLLLLV